MRFAQQRFALLALGNRGGWVVCTAEAVITYGHGHPWGYPWVTGTAPKAGPADQWISS